MIPERSLSGARGAGTYLGATELTGPRACASAGTAYLRLSEWACPKTVLAVMASARHEGNIDSHQDWKGRR